MEKVSKCTTCSQKFNSGAKLNAHILIHHKGIHPAKQKQSQCNVCGYAALNGSHLIKHMSKHTGERPFKCTAGDCGIEFKQVSHLKNHAKYKHNDERSLKCKYPGCLGMAKTISALAGHQKVHSNDRPFACSNDGCDFRAKGWSSLNRHVISVHSQVKIFPCPECGYKTARKDQLKEHIQRRHTSKWDFKCSHPQCTEAFKSLYDLKFHFSNRHEKRNIPCNHPGCGRKFANAKALYKHKWGVHSNNLYNCPNSDCNYRTNEMRKLTSHMIVHDKANTKIPCLMKGCEYKGKNSRGLELHMRRHEIRLACPLAGCGRYFTREGLQDHVRLHEPLGRPFQCPLCFLHYPTRSKLKRHTTSHTQEKPFKCGQCEYRAASRSRVKKHIFSLHAKLQFPLIVLPSNDYECLHCKVALPVAEFLVHSVGHAVPVVFMERLKLK